MAIKDDYDRLTSSPFGFLSKNIVKCVLSRSRTNTRGGKFYKKQTGIGQVPTFEISSYVPPGVDHIDIRVFYVGILPRKDVKTKFRIFDGIQFPSDQDIGLMVTPPLSGCSLVYQGMAGTGPYLAHVQPEYVIGSSIQGITLQNFLEQGDGPRFFQSGNTRASVFGRNNYGRQGVNPIGVHVNGMWSLLAQYVSNPNMENEKITRLQGLF